VFVFNPSPLIALSHVPQTSVLGPLLFNPLMIHVAILKDPVFFLLLMENKNVHRIISVSYSLLLQPDVNSVHNWYTANHMVRQNFLYKTLIS
jgi:hypothetical protein